MRDPFLTDLTDDQWARLYPEVLAPAGYADTIRPVIDGLLYRHRACGVWWLVPPGFPPEAELRAHHEEMVRTGVWEAILTAVSRGAPAPRGRLAAVRSTLAAVRAGAASVLRRLPGGRLLAPPLRGAVKVCELLSRLCSPKHHRLWRFHRLINTALARIGRGDRETAIGYLTRALELFPDHICPLIWRGRALFVLKRYAEAERDLWRALASPLALPDNHADAHSALACCAILLDRDVKRAAEHLTEVEWAYQRPRKRFEESIGLVTRLDALMTAHDDLAEYLINTHMNFDTALEVYRRKAVVRAEYAPRILHFPSPKTLYLSEDWVRNIGHTAYLDTFVKMQRLGWTTWDRLVLLAPPRSTANLHYARYWERYCEVVTDTRTTEALRPATRMTGPRVASLLNLPGGVEKYFTEGIGIVQQEWEREDRPPLLTLTAEDQEYGRAILARLGVPADGWFVCLHVREPGYHREEGNDHQSHRNADARTYLPAIREIVARGGWVIRMGDKTMKPLPRTPGLIDYARSSLKSERMDVFLCGACRFFVGVASGLCHIPTTFGLPCVLTNWSSNALPVYSRYDLFLPKLIRSVAADRPLTFAEMFDTFPRRAAYSNVFLKTHGMQAIDNTPGEILDVVTEMLDQLDEKAAYTGQDGENQARLAALLRGYGHDGFARMGRGFLRRYAGLLPNTLSEQLPAPAAA